MSTVTKWLGVVAGLLICMEVAGPAIASLFFEPLATNQQTLIKATSRLRVKELALRQAEVTARKLQERLHLNFEPDVARARLAYQEYLMKLSDECGLSSVMISCAQPEHLEELGEVLRFSVQGTGTTEQIGRLIESFYHTKALHRLNHITIFQSLGPDSPTHSLALDVALLVMDLSSDTPSKLTLPSSGAFVNLFAGQDIFRKRSAVPDTTSGPTLASSVDMLNSLMRNLPALPTEQPVVETPADPPPVTTKSPEIDPKDQIRLVGIIAQGVKKYALFTDTANQIQFTVAEQSDLSDHGINARLIRIQSEDVSLAVEDQTLDLALGQLYSEAIVRTPGQP